MKYNNMQSLAYIW